MPKLDLSSIISDATEKYGLASGAYLKIKEGANKIRLLSETAPHQSWYKGTKTFKFVCWVFDYKDEKVKLYFMPLTVAKAIESLQLSDDYKFDEVPMPYDITINAKDAGTKEVDYSVVPARSNSLVPDNALAQFSEKAPINDVLAKLKESETQNPEKQPPADNSGIKKEEVPF